MKTSKISTEVLPNGHQGNGERLQITPEERFKIRTSVEETAGACATKEQIAEVRYGPGGAIYRVVITPEQTGNTLFAFEAKEPPGGGPPLHIQTREEEFFFVLAGEISFWIGGQVSKRSAGGTAFVPRDVPHCFKKLFGQACARADTVHARRHRRVLRLRQAPRKWPRAIG